MPAAVRPRTVLIAGPTASGKSALALDLAERLGGVVVNADSMQVYRDLKLVSARPSTADEARAPHLLYGHVDASEAYSAGRFVLDAGRVLAENPGLPLIFVGGTGLYFEALTRGLSTVSQVPDEVRARWRAYAASVPPEELHAELSRRDPDMAAQLRPSDSQRLIRALEVIDATGISLSAWQRIAGSPLIDLAEAKRIVLSVDRTELRARIARRFARMVEEGALDEVRRLDERGLDPALPALKAIGVPQLAAFLAGQIPLEAAIARAVILSGQYAKRQDTWFRNRFADWPKMSPEAARQMVLGTE